MRLSRPRPIKSLIDAGGISVIPGYRTPYILKIFRRRRITDLSQAPKYYFSRPILSNIYNIIALFLLIYI